MSLPQSQIPVGEFGLINWIRHQGGSNPALRLGIGDDAAVLRLSPGADLIATTDMLLDGRHFLLEEHGAEAVGGKALGVNLSDIAAMAGRPLAALVAVALPGAAAIEVAQGIMAGMAPLAERFGVVLAGGDTNAWNDRLAISVTLLGETVQPGPVLRSGARPGDVVLVTGPLGGSLLGRHMKPFPRVKEALALLNAAPLHALIDVSDGLAADLGHILEESGALGAILDSERIPIHPDAERLASSDGRTPLEHALHDGEDFELCLTVADKVADRLLASQPEGVTLHRVGRITSEPGLWLRHVEGGVEPLDPRGFDHLAT